MYVRKPKLILLRSEKRFMWPKLFVVVLLLLLLFMLLVSVLWFMSVNACGNGSSGKNHFALDVYVRQEAEVGLAEVGEEVVLLDQGLPVVSELVVGKL